MRDMSRNNYGCVPYLQGNTAVVVISINYLFSFIGYLHSFLNS